MKVKPGFDPPPLPPRLIGESELGPIVKVLNNKLAKKPGSSKGGSSKGGSIEVQDYGRGKRAREVKCAGSYFVLPSLSILELISYQSNTLFQVVYYVYLSHQLFRAVRVLIWV